MLESQPDTPVLPAGYEFHHLGFATESIESELRWLKALGYTPDGAEFVDPIQGIIGRFLIGLGPRIELLQNLSGQRTLSRWLERGVRVYHFAYLVQDVQQAVSWAHGFGAKVTVPPVPAVAFAMRPICFVVFRNGMMLEFIEK